MSGAGEWMQRLRVGMCWRVGSRLKIRMLAQGTGCRKYSSSVSLNATLLKEVARAKRHEEPSVVHSLCPGTEVGRQEVRPALQREASGYVHERLLETADVAVGV